MISYLGLTDKAWSLLRGLAGFIEAKSFNVAVGRNALGLDSALDLLDLHASHFGTKLCQTIAKIPKLLTKLKESLAHLLDYLKDKLCKTLLYVMYLLKKEFASYHIGYLYSTHHNFLKILFSSNLRDGCYKRTRVRLALYQQCLVEDLEDVWERI